MRVAERRDRFGSLIACVSQRGEPASELARSRVSAIVAGARVPSGTPLMTPTAVSLSTNISFTRFACESSARPAALHSSPRG